MWLKQVLCWQYLIDSLKAQLQNSQKESEFASEEIKTLEEENENLSKTIKMLEQQLRDMQSLQIDAEDVPEEAVEEVKEDTTLDSLLSEYIDEETDIKKYIERYLESYGITDMEVSSEKNSQNNQFYNVVIGSKKLNAKVNNGKFYVKGGGGWYTLKQFIEVFIIKMQASKKDKIANKVLVSRTFILWIF